MDLHLATIVPLIPHTHTVVFLHGRGDNAKNFALSLLHSRDSKNRSLPDIFPSFRWVFPQPKMGEESAVQGSEMYQWFDIWNVRDFSDREEIQAPGLKESVANIRRSLATEAVLLDGQWENIILAGISQGAATSVHTLLNLTLPPQTTTDGQNVPRRLGAFLGFSCRMPFPGKSLAETRSVLSLDSVLDNDEFLRNTPVLLEHCVDDPLVLVQNGRALRETLRRFGAQVTWKEYPDGGHWFNSPQGIDDAVVFLNEHLRLNIPSAAGQLPTQSGANPDSMDIS